MRLSSTLCVVALFSAPALAADPEFVPPSKDASKIPAGKYLIDESHTHVVFKINHLGYSNYIGRFNHVSGTLQFDPADISKSTVEVSVPVGSVDTTSDELDAKLADTSFFNTSKFPDATFRSTKIEKTGDTTGTIHGDLTFLGVTKPVALKTVFNGVGDNSYTGKKNLGFSATTTIKRSDFGMIAYAPALGDEVELIIETEFAKAE